MIPKKIHYVWVGDQEKPASVLECINSWKKNLPEYELIEWSNEQYHQIKNTYSEQAYAQKKWAFVSDYMRVYALYYHGGIYLDTDVKVNNSFDEFLTNDFFSSHEDYHGKISPITTAVMGAVPQHQIMKDMLDIYNCERFERPRGLNLQTNTSRFTKYFEKTYNIHAPYQPDNKIKLADKIIIYPTHYFCTPKNGQPCYATHEFNASWQDSHQRRVKLALGQLAVISFKENVALNTLDLPLKDNEKLLFKVPLGKGKTLALIKTTT